MPIRAQKERAVMKREIRNPAIDRTRPAYLVIERFDSLADFCKKTGYHSSTVYDWLLKGLIPADRQEYILNIARQHRIELPPILFVPGAS